MSQVKVNSIVDASGGSNAVLYGVASPPNSMGFRNRLINPGMVIDQRNAGATGTGNGVYTVDRWNFGSGVAGKMTWGQNYNSLTPPSGFTNYFGFKTTTAYTVGATDFFLFTQEIEGYNVADFDLGKSTARTFTLSFWVNSSLTGTFGGCFSNSAQNRSYPFTYTISAANTWEQKTITVVGDTTGTWLTTNGKGLSLYFGLGVGSTYSGTAGSWAGATYLGATGATSVVGTLNATWNITGVQLEAGTNASAFEARDYGRELMMCQRYYEKSFNVDTAPAQNAGTTGAFYFAQSAGASASQMGAPVRFKVEKRASPTTLTLYNPSATNAQIRNDVTNSDWSGSATGNGGTSGFRVYGTSPAGSSAGNSGLFHWSGEAEL